MVATMIELKEKPLIITIHLQSESGHLRLEQKIFFDFFNFKHYCLGHEVFDQIFFDVWFKNLVVPKLLILATKWSSGNVVTYLLYWHWHFSNLLLQLDLSAANVS